MATIRPGRCYKKLHRPNTRQSTRKPRKSYVKGVPKIKVTDFITGEKKSFPKTVALLSKGAVQIRDNALEAARVVATQMLEKTFGKPAGYFFRLRPYPHQVLRENPLATGAGADRFQQGMRQSYGNPIGSAARIRAGQIIMEVQTDEANVRRAKAALDAARYKLPVPCRIIVENTE
jgi:large subunit ribosomal protein L10e